MRKTKIICTLGPSTDNDEIIREMICLGMDVARFNFSHGDHDEHLNRLRRLEKLRDEMNIPVATLMDTRGPEIRIGTFKSNQKVHLKAGQQFVLTTRQIEGDETQVSISYPSLVYDVDPGVKILIDDGLIEMTVEEVTATDIICKVKNNGIISNNKGVNIPGVRLSMPYISEKDRLDILFAIEHKFDFIAASFVRTVDDVMEIRKMLNKHHSQTRIIAKIENLQIVNNIDEIIKESDGIMIARGDMGVEIPFEELPAIQRLLKGV